MKIKHVIASLSLALTTAFGVAVGLGAQKEAKAAKAEAKTWMTQFTIDMSDIIDAPDWSGVDMSTLKLKVWNNSDYDGTIKEVSFHELGKEKFYTVNLGFEASYSYNRTQVYFLQNSEAKYSIVDETSQSSASHFEGVKLVASKEWNTSKGGWEMMYAGISAPQIKFGSSLEPVTLPLTLDYEKGEYYTTGLVVAAQGISSNFLTLYMNQSYAYLKDALTDSSKDYAGSINNEWMSFKEAGTYDIFLRNSFEDNGILVIKKHEGPVASYIYYVLEDNTPTNDYIYAWGGSEQFGSWPGMKLTDNDGHPVSGVEEVSGNGVLHFEGDVTPRLIYKISVSIGYPTGDLNFKWNNGKNQNEEGYWASDTGTFVAGAAYWSTAIANPEAGEAIDFLVKVEGKRNAADQSSICKVSVDDAAALYNEYVDLDADVKDYVDRSSVWTHKKDKTEGEELVSYADVMIQLGKRGGILPSNATYGNSIFAGNNTAILVIMIASIVGALSLTCFLVFKKKNK